MTCAYKNLKMSTLCWDKSDGQNFTNLKIVFRAIFKTENHDISQKYELNRTVLLSGPLRQDICNPLFLTILLLKSKYVLTVTSMHIKLFE